MKYYFHSAGVDEASNFLFLRKLSLNYLTIRRSNLSDDHLCELLHYLDPDELNYLDLSRNLLGINAAQCRRAIEVIINVHGSFHVDTLKLFGNPIDVEDKLNQALFLEIRKIKRISVFQIQEGEPLSEAEIHTLVRLMEKVGASPNKAHEIREMRRKIANRGIAPHEVGRGLRALKFYDDD